MNQSLRKKSGGFSLGMIHIIPKIFYQTNFSLAVYINYDKIRYEYFRHSQKSV